MALLAYLFVWLNSFSTAVDRVDSVAFRVTACLSQMKSLWNFVSWTVSTVGLGWQLYFIFNQYFAYPTSTNVNIDIPEIAVVPNVSIYHGSSGEHKAAMERNETLESVCKLSPHLGQTKYAFEIQGKTRYATNKLISYALVQYDFLYRHQHDLLSDTMVVFYSNATQLPANGTYYIEAHTKFSAASTAAVDAKFSALITYYVITYELFSSQLLEPPYRTQCYDYDTIGYVSARDCFEDCRKSLAVEKFNQFYFDTFVECEPRMKYNNATSSNCYRVDNNMCEPAQLASARANIESRCRRHCFLGRPCYKDITVTTIIAKGHSPDTAQFKYFFYLDTPKRPFTATVHEPAITLTDFIVYVLSSFSFWLGVAPLTMMSNFRKIVRKHKRRQVRSSGANIAERQGESSGAVEI